MPPVESRLAFLVELRCFFGHQHDLVGLTVVVEAQGPNRPLGEHRLFEGQGDIGCHRTDSRQVGQQLHERLGQRPHLLLLELSR